MAMTTANSGPIIRPEQVDTLVVRPVTQVSIATQVARVVQTSSQTFRSPIVTDDPSAGWVAEGAEIPLSDATLAEIDVTPSKLAALTVISNELAEDSTPEAATTVGQGIARDIARKLDIAYFGNLNSPAPKGLAGLTGVTTVSATAAALSNVDPYLDAIAGAEAVGATLTAFVANPADVLNLAKAKQASGSQVPLFGPDPTEPTVRRISGVPILSSTAVAAGTIWGIPQGLTTVVIRRDTTLDVDRSAFFTSDRTAIRATLRVGFGFPHPAAVVKIVKSN